MKGINVQAENKSDRNREYKGDKNRDRNRDHKNDRNRSYTVQKGYSCAHCSGDHGIWNCPSFAALSTVGKWYKVKQLKVCYRCLGSSHMGNNCYRTRECGIDGCKKNHHKLLHETELNDSSRIECNWKW